MSLVWVCACTSKTGPQWIEPRSVSLLPAEKTVQVGEQFQLAASVKMGESVPMLAGKSVELEVFWFDGTSLQPIPSTQLKFISKDSSLISVSGTTVTSADDAVGRTFLALQIAGSEMTLCTVSVEKDGSKPSVLDSYIEEKPGWR